MALDTRSKRASSVGILLPFVLAPVLPDGTIDQGDRQHTALSYSGILATAAVAIAVVLDVELVVSLVTSLALTDAAVTNLSVAVATRTS
jgi:hypothetical protein